jgi:hypothetical protein
MKCPSIDEEKKPCYFCERNSRSRQVSMFPVPFKPVIRAYNLSGKGMVLPSIKI